jgi:hypothetical protein
MPEAESLASPDGQQGRSPIRRLCAAVVLLALGGCGHPVGPSPAPPTAAQGDDSRAARSDESEPGDHFGWYVCGIQDMDGDGYPDVVAGAPGRSVPHSGWVGAYSAATGEPLVEYVARGADRSLGWCAQPLGDINQDGLADFAVAVARANPRGSPEGGPVRVCSGADGALLGTIGPEFPRDGSGASMVALPVPGAAGQSTIVIGAPWAADQRGRLIAYSVPSGVELWRADATEAESRLGWSLCRVGDVNADGVADIAAGAPATQSDTGEHLVGCVVVICGRTGARLSSSRGSQPGWRFGFAVAGMCGAVGDTDAILVVGSPRPEGSAGGRVELISCRDGGVLLRVSDSRAGPSFGRAVACVAADENGKVVAIAIGEPDFASDSAALTGRVLLVSARSGAPIHEVLGEAEGERLGFSVAALGDIDGDGVSDIAAGAPGTSVGGVSGAGSVLILSGKTGRVIRRITRASPP